MTEMQAATRRVVLPSVHRANVCRSHHLLITMKRKGSPGSEDAIAQSKQTFTATSNRRRRRAPATTVDAQHTTPPSSEEPQRCGWATMYKGAASKEYIKYHDEEWGRPLHDDTQLFELLILEGAQAGLSWSTILAKREAYRTAFDGFDPRKVAGYDEQKLQQLMSEGSGVVRHKGKLESAVRNAKTSESEALSSALKKAGMTFVGPTIMYSFMQAAGMVNDHILGCHCRQALAASDAAEQVKD